MYSYPKIATVGPKAEVFNASHVIPPSFVIINAVGRKSWEKYPSYPIPFRESEKL